MNFGHNEVDSVQRMLANETPNRLDEIIISGISIGAALELACYKWHCSHSGHVRWASVIDKLSPNHDILGSAITMLNQRGLTQSPLPSLSATPRYEVYPVPLFSQSGELQWTMFQRRFRSSLLANGFGKPTALALSKALAEMVDNVIQHSGPSVQEQSGGIVAYHVEANTMEFAVADIGRGVLASLQTNTSLQHIKDNETALKLAILDRRTSRLNATYGDGFQNVLVAMADMNGLMRFRSGDACLTLDGRGDARKIVTGFVPDLIGLQLTVICSTKDSIPQLWI